MEEKEEQAVSSEWFKDLPIQMENPAFDAEGFDFSSLETEKAMLAVENMRKLVKKLREVAPDAKFVDDYLQVRESLGGIWEVELKTDSQGLKRKGFGNFNLSNVTVADNKIQFTKYSRLQ